MVQKKSILPLKWIIAGFVFCAAYMVVAWKVAISVYASYGLLVAIVAVLAILALGKFLVSPLIIKFLKSRKPVV